MIQYTIAEVIDLPDGTITIVIDCVYLHLIIIEYA